MKKLSGQEIREMWLNFFKEKGHHVEKGASLIPYQDPSLLWINSGVAALKKYMDGSEVPPSRRITNVQKSIRTNDMDNVGYTSRHHTFFEMLGNFSIGDYFRESVIPWAFEILTSEKYFAMPKERLYFTYNPADLETKELWKKCGVEETHLIPLEGNYWEIGEGPAGPNTEVFFDKGEKYDPNHIGDKLLRNDMENDRYIEIWGIVFSQYNAVPGTPRTEYKELPSKNIDTGAGLERICSVLQETPSNYETDLFMPIIKEIEKISNKQYEENLTAFRVIADHIRAVTFATNDGEVFSNEGRGYVLRRLVRRAMRFGKTLGLNEPFLYKLIKTVIDIYKDFYPELLGNENHLKQMLKIEEEKFIRTLNSGESLLRDMVKNKNTLNGKDAFMLYDTYGFPIDLTKEICSELNISVDEDGFKKEMELQKERARNARSDEQSMHKQSKALLDFIESSSFTYDEYSLQAKVIGLFKNGDQVNELNESGEIIFDNTCFFAESGGEVSDKGFIFNEQSSANVINVIKAPNKQHLHYVTIDNGSIKVGDVFNLKINKEERELTKRNHSGTHLLQSALNEVLGNNIKQMGSFVCSDYLRFDFTHNEKISKEQLDLIELKVNEYIANSYSGNIKVLPIEEAKKLGAKAFFSEKYGDEVRVVSFGDVSMEFCGGCHVNNTHEIGTFTIVSEESIASGVRRIVGKTSIGAYKFSKENEKVITKIKSKVQAKTLDELNLRIESLLKEKEELKTQVNKLNEKISNNEAKLLKESFETINGYNVLAKHIVDADTQTLIRMGDNLKNIYNDYVIVLVGGNNGELPISCFVGGKALEQNSAGIIVKTIANVLGGQGGGRPNMANGKGKDLSKMQNALSTLKEIIK